VLSLGGLLRQLVLQRTYPGCAPRALA